MTAAAQPAAGAGASGVLSHEELRRRVAVLVSRASDGEVTTEEVLDAGGSLTAVGVTSLTLLRLIDAVEDEFGILLDLDGPVTALDDFDALVSHLAGPGARRGDG
ncbi:phosphopantetheine-binding protein [Streptomyces sp. NPDC058231]|uniref:phosphopantetheine-binding protein n=1 Tax=Streptomyces sp. NPDC058231 TaxID=3346392 RepID=UPI0036EDA680